MKHIFLSIIFASFYFAAMSQSDDDILLTVGSKKVTAGEYKYIYEKNNRSDISKKTPNDYMDLFVNFKLKVVEAEALKMDTAESFINEFEGYKTQLAKPYLTENIKINQLIKEAYERSKKDVKLDILFFKLPYNPSSEDTLLVFQKASDVRSDLMKGAQWDTIAVKYSDDRGVQRNKGHLPFISANKIPYGLQNYIFKAQKNEISQPIRTKSGYYIIRKVDERDNPGSIKVAHIMVSAPKSLTKKQSDSTKVRIDSIYNALKNGADFAELAKLSDDKSSGQNGGELSWFSTGRMVPEFEQAAFSLKNKGDYTEPIKTTFGWHIIKLIDKKGVKSFEESKEGLQNLIERDHERQELIQNYVRYKLKKEFNFKEINKPVKLYKMLDSTVFQAKWKAGDISALSETLFKVNGKKYTEKDFTEYIELNQKRTRKTDLKDYVNDMYKKYITSVLVDTEIEELSKKEPTYRYLLQEYHDGMLLFELMEKEVWNKASQDTAGLLAFYEKNKENYAGKIELDLSIFEYGDPKIVKKAKKKLVKNKQFKPENIAKIVSEDEKEFKFIERKTYMEGQNKYAEELFKKLNKGEKIKRFDIIDLPDMHVLILVNDKIQGRTKAFDEIKGLVISDYQAYLEEQWVKELKQKYPVKINEKVFNRVKAELN